MAAHVVKKRPASALDEVASEAPGTPEDPEPQPVTATAGAPESQQSQKKRSSGTLLSSIQQLPDGVPLGKAIATAVIDRLKQLEKDGNPEPRRQYGLCSTTALKKEFAMQLSVDPAATFCKVTKSRRLGKKTERQALSGPMALWEIAKLEGLPFTEEFLPLLKGLVEGVPSHPHPKPNLAAEGHLVYEYLKKLPQKTTNSDDQSLTLTKKTILK